MKLRINAKLKAALIAAIATVGFTLPQAQAAGVVQWTSTFNVTGTGVGEWTASETSAVDLAASNWSLTKIGGTAIGSKSASDGQLRPDTNVQTASGWVLSFDITNGGAAAQTLSSVSVDSFLFNGSNGYQGNGTDRKFNATLTYGNPSQSVSTGEFTIHGKGDAHPENGVVNLAFTDAVTLGTNDTLHIAVQFDKASEALGCFVGLNGISLIYTPDALVWKGTEAQHAWSQDSSWSSPFTAGADVVFDGTADYLTATVDADTTASSISVNASGKNHTFDLAHNLTTGGLDIAANSILALDGSGTMTVTGTLTCDGLLDIASGAKLKVDSAPQAKALMLSNGKVANKGTLVIGDNVTLDSSATTTMTGTLAIAAGKKLTIGTNKDNQSYDFTSLDALVLEQGANIDTKALKVDIKNLTANGSTIKMLDTKDKNQVGVDLKGTTTLDGNLTITSDWKYKVNIEKLAGEGNLILTGGWEEHRAVIGDADINSISVKSAMTETWLNGTVKLSDTLDLNGGTTYAGENGSLTVGGLTGTTALAAANGITFTGAGEYTYTGALTAGGQIVKQGTGTQTIGNASLVRAFDVQAGTLALTGTYAIDHITDGETVDKYFDYEGAEGNNGFYLQTGSITVYTVAKEDASINVEGAHFTYGGQDVTSAVVDDGSYDIPVGDPNYTTYHLNEAGASVDLAAAYTYSQGALTTVNVNGATGTLTTDSAVSLATLNVASGSTATVDGTGSVSVTTLSNSGSVKVAGDLAVANALTLPVTDTPAIQVLSGGVLTLSTASTIGGQGLVNGTDGEQGNSAAFSNLFQGKAVSVADGGLLVMQGNIITTDHGGGEMDMALSSLKVEGKLTVNTWSAANYKLNGHSLEVTDNLWLKNHQDVTVGNGSLTVGGQLQISHEGNNAGGQYKVAITAGAGKVSLGSIGLYGGGNTMSLDGTTLTFTSDAGNVINKLGTAGNDNTVITLANTKLVADASSWTLAPIDGVTVAMTGANTIDVAAEKTITLTVSSLNGAITKTGEGSLVFTSASEGTLTDSIKVQQGALTLSGTYVIDNIMAGSVVEKYVDTTGTENPNGGFYQQSGTKTVYTVAEGIASINVAGAQFTYGGKDVTASVVDGSYELPSDPIKTTLWVNSGELAYDDYYAASDGALTTAKVAGNATLTVGTNAVGTLEYQTNGTTITLAGTGTVNAISGTGILNMAAGAHVAVPSLTVNSAVGVYSTGTGTLALDDVTISGGGSIEFDSYTEIGTTHLTGGSITFGGTGTTHKLTDLGLSQDGGSASTVNVKAGTTVHIVGTTVAKDRDSRFMGSFSLSHWSADNTVNVYGTLISDVVVSSCDGKGIINVENGGRLEMRDGLNRGNYNDNAITFNVKSGATLAAGTTHNTTETKNSNNVVVNLEGGSTFEAYYGAQDTTAVINKVLTFGEGVITMNAGAEGKTLQLNSNIAGEGVTIAKTGEGALELNGNANVLYNTIDLQAGTLALNGTFDVSNISHTQGTVEYYATPDAQESSANGFAKYTGTAQLVNANYGNVTVGDNAVITLDGYAVGYNVTTGKVGGTISLATYYINRDSERLSVIQATSPNAGVALADGAKLVVDADLSAALTVAAGGKGYVEIGGGHLLNSTTAAVELSGSGTYALADNTVSLGSVTLGEDWTGTVRLSNINKSDGNTHLDALVHGDSWVEISGIKSGFLPEWSGGHVDVNIKLTNPDAETPAWVWNDGSGSTNYTLTFTGDWAGQGTFRKEADKHQSFTWTGNIAAWTGKFEFASNDKSSNLTFAGSATQVNAEIAKPGTGTLNLIVGDGANVFATEFTKSVTVSSITVKDNASATFNELHITQAITSTGTVTLNQDLEVSGFTQYDGAAGYYDLEGAFTLDGNGYSGMADSYITIVSGGTVAGEITVTQGDTTYDLLNSGNATLAGSGEATIDYTTFFVNKDSVDVSSITDGRTTGIQVSGGTLNVDTDASGFTIDVLEEGTISGDHVDATQVGIDNMATAHFSQPVETAGVEYAAAEGDVVSVRNIGEKAEFSTSNKDMIVYAETLTMTDTENDAVVGNLLWVNEVVNETGKKLTLENADNLLLDAMTIGAGSTVAVYTEGAESPEGTVTITESLTAGGGTLLANLTIIGNGSEVAPTLLNLGGAGENALTLGSTLTVDTESGLILLDADTIAALEGLALGHNLDLFKALEETQLNYGAEYNGTWFDAMFVRTADVRGDYLVYASDTSFGLTKVSKTPEPTTGTLSLLALAALAARRRKH